MCVYASEADKKRLLFDPVKRFLENNGAILYVTSDLKPSEVEKSMANYGVDVENDGLMILSFEEFYMTHGSFEWEALWKRYGKIIAQAMKFRGFMSVAEVAGFYKHKALDILLENERKAETERRRGKNLNLFKATGVCAYSLEMLLKSQPYVYGEAAKEHEVVLGKNLNRFPITVDVDLDCLRRLMARFPWLGDSAEQFVSESVVRRMEDLLQTCGPSQPSPLSQTQQTAADSHK